MVLQPGQRDGLFRPDLGHGAVAVGLGDPGPAGEGARPMAGLAVATTRQALSELERSSRTEPGQTGPSQDRTRVVHAWSMGQSGSETNQN